VRPERRRPRASRSWKSEYEKVALAPRLSPMTAQLLRQVLGGLRPGTSYTLRWEARTQGIASPTGIEWFVLNSAGAVAATEDWSKGEMTFKPSTDHATLELVYRRPAGQVRTEGHLDIRRVTSSPE